MRFEEEVSIFRELGVTRIQTELYLTLLKIGKTDGKTLTRRTNLPRPEVYRTLEELQEKGLVEKEITQPYTFTAIPIQQGLQMLMTQKFEKCNTIQDKIENLLQKIENKKTEKVLDEQEYQLIMVDHKERIIQKMRQQHEDAQNEVVVLSNPQRWLLILHYCLENYERALERGVWYRVVIENSENGIASQKNVQMLLSRPNFEMKLSNGSFCTSAALFDRKEATFAFHPSRALGESPIILTNHPSFLTMLQEHFENVWKKASRFKVQNENADNEVFAT